MGTKRKYNPTIIGRFSFDLEKIVAESQVFYSSLRRYFWPYFRPVDQIVDNGIHWLNVNLSVKVHSKR